MLAEIVLIPLAILLMLLALPASLLPAVPGPALVWAIGVIFAVLTGFARVGWPSVAVMTVLMVLGSASGWWMQALGMRSQGSSCLAILGALLGGLVGTFAIPIPILGTLLGLVMGAILFEFLRAGELNLAIRTGGAAAAGYALSTIVEVGISLLIFAVFIASLLISG